MPFGEKENMVTRATSSRKTKAAAADRTSNVIVLPVTQHAGPLTVQPMLFAGDDIPDMPPWLVEDKKSVDVKPKAKRALAKKKVAAKQAKPKAKTAPKKRASPKRSKSEVTKIQPVPETQPLARSRAPVLWQKNSPIAALRYWLRTAGRNVAGLMTPVKRVGPKLRTRKELLLEIAVLRQENAVMRKQLNLPAMPFGRTVADSA
jgi:type IV secretory pathway VirB10-like protein